MVKAQDFLHYVKNVSCDLSGGIKKNWRNFRWGAEHFGYVLGGQGELYTKELAEKWGKTRNAPSSWKKSDASYFTGACKHWYGFRIEDCSGMVVDAHRAGGKSYSDRRADTFHEQFKGGGRIKEIPEIPGLGVWKPGHIGVYVGNGRVVECRGKDYGTVETPLSSQPWKEWGYFRDVEYPPVSWAVEKYPALQKGNYDRKKNYALKKGDPNGYKYVKIMQNALEAKGCSVGKHGIDGDFGKDTRAALVSFQKANGLTSGGVCKTDTWRKLLGAE